MRWILLSYLLITSCVYGQLSYSSDTIQSSELILSFQKRNEKVKEIHLPSGSSIELSLRTPDDSLITYYNHTVSGKMTNCTDSTITLAVTSTYRYVNFSDGSWLEDMYERSSDSTNMQTVHLDSITSIYSNREWLRNPRKICMNLTRIFIGVSTINNLAGDGNLTNSILFALGIAGVGCEFALSGKTYWLEPPTRRFVYPRRLWKVHAE